MRVDDCIFFRLAKAAQAGAVFWGEKVDRLNLTAVQALVMNFLREEDKIPSHALAEKLKITGATMTGIIDRLEKMELVFRVPDEVDRRSVRVCLTEKGAEIARDLDAVAEDANKEFLLRFSPEETVFFKSLLKRIMDR